MAFTIQIRRDLLANWEINNPVLAEAELAYETDTRKVKIGDGVNGYTSLPYLAEDRINLLVNGVTGATGISSINFSGFFTVSPDGYVDLSQFLGPTGATGPAGATGSAEIDLYGPTGIFVTNPTSFGITGPTVYTTNINGVPYYNVSRTRSYAARFDYDASSNLTSGSETILTGQDWLSSGFSVNVSSNMDVRFSFANETTPPKGIYGYFYNANSDTYVLSTFGLGNNAYLITGNLSSTISNSVATNNFFTSFNNYELMMNLTPSNYGGDRQPIPPINTHSYVIFTF